MLNLTTIVAVLTAIATSPATQVPTPGSPTQAAVADSGKKAAQTPPARYALTRVLRFSDGSPVAGATVMATAVRAGPESVARLATTDMTGRFTIDSLPAGDYDLTMVYSAEARPAIQRVTVSGAGSGNILVVTQRESSGWWTFLVLVIYLLTILATRWNHIAKSLQAMLQGEIIALRTRLHTEVDSSNSAAIDRLNSDITSIEDKYKEPQAKLRNQSFLHPLEWLFWTRGRENAEWVAIHEAEQQLTAVLSPPALVVSYLRVTQAQLQAMQNAPAAAALAGAIHDELESAPDAATTAAREAYRKALLGRGIALIYDDRDRQFATLMEWHNKASWLILCALIVIASLVFAAGHAVLCLAGAAGGFSSRLMRALRRDSLPLDYGASWTTLFLSPLFGALAGWFGIAIIALGTQPNINLLGDAFKLVSWHTPYAPITLAAAFLWGFSERFFDALVGAVEAHAGATQDRPPSKGAGTTVATQTAPVGQTGSAAAGPKPDSSSPPPKSAGGVTIDLGPSPLPVQTVRGKVSLDKARASDTAVNLSTTNPDCSFSSAVLTIPVGALEAGFDLIPKGRPPAATVRVTARVGTVEVSDAIEFS